MPQVVIKDGLGSPITLHEYKGKHFPVFPVLDHNLTHLPDMPCRDDDVMILSYPKTGKHWTWQVVNMLYTGEGQISTRNRRESFLELASIDAMTALPSARLFCTHLTPEFYPKDLIKRKCKIVFVQRNPKDVYVSYFHHTSKIKVYDYAGDWNGYFELIMGGKNDYGSWFDFTKQWEEFFAEHPDIPLLRLYYEDMKLDLPSEVERIAQFLDVSCSLGYRDKVTESCGFDAMKKQEILPQKMIDTVFKTKSKHYPLFRKGIIGDWKNHFTLAQNERFDAEYKKQMKGFTFKFEQYM